MGGITEPEDRFWYRNTKPEYFLEILKNTKNKQENWVIVQFVALADKFSILYFCFVRNLIFTNTNDLSYKHLYVLHINDIIIQYTTSSAQEIKKRLFQEIEKKSVLYILCLKCATNSGGTKDDF